MATDRKFLAGDKLVSRAEYVEFLKRCAADWRRVADRSFYGLKRREVDPGAIAMAERIEAQAKVIESGGEFSAKPVRLSDDERRERQAEYDDQYPPPDELPAP